MRKDTNHVKTNFGKRKGGKAKKRYSPKDKQVKKSVGQG
jgi:hypothetical protein